MEVGATLKGSQISAQKARLVARQISGLPIARALSILAFSPKKAAYLVNKVLNSAVANAENNESSDIDDFVYIADLCQ